MEVAAEVQDEIMDIITDESVPADKQFAFE